MYNISKFLNSSINYIHISFRYTLDAFDASRIAIKFVYEARNSLYSEEAYCNLLIDCIKETCSKHQQQEVLRCDSVLKALAKKLYKRELKIYNSN